MKFLIVDDDLNNRRLFEAMLLGIGDLDMASSGQEAIKLVKDRIAENAPYHVIFLDALVAGIRGLDLLRALQLIEKRYGIPLGNGAKMVIVDTLKGVQSAHTISSDYHLTKPIQQVKVFELLIEMGFNI